MRLFHTADGKYYRRWVNVVLTWFLPGSAQFLSGRKTQGWSCVAGFVLLFAWIAALCHPAVPWSVLDPIALGVPFLAFPIVAMVDAARHPIQRLSWIGWLSFFAVYAGVLILSLVPRTFIMEPFKIPTGAMAPTLLGLRTDDDGEEIPGDHIWVNRLAYRSHGPQRGDVVVFKTAGIPLVPQDTHYVKRVVGLPGETVSIDSPYVVVDGNRVLDPPVFREIAERQNGHCGYVAAGTVSGKTFPLASPSDRITLGVDEYMVFGDNSTNSFDGRYYGPVKRQSIIGKAEFIYAPADRKRWLR